MKSLVLDALSKLNPQNDKHWTSDGLPSVDSVRALAANNEITRSDIKDAAPSFNRANLELPIMSDPEKLLESVVEELTTEERVELATWLRAQIAQKTTSHGELLSEFKQLESRLRGFSNSIEELEAKLQKVDPPPSNEEIIRHHLNLVQKQRVEDFAKNPIVDIDAASPLDKAFRRSNKRPQMAI